MANEIYDFSADPDLIDFSQDTDLLGAGPVPPQTYTDNALKIARVAGPVAAIGIRGLTAIPDLLQMGYNALAPKAYEIGPSLGDMAAEYVYPSDMRKQAEAYIAPTGLTGKALLAGSRGIGDAANFVLSGGGITKLLGTAGKVAAGANMARTGNVLGTLGTYAPAAQKTDVALGLAAGAAGETFGDKAETAVALSPLALAAGKGLTRIPYLMDALEYAGGKAADAGNFLTGGVVPKLKDWGIAKITEGRPQLNELITKSPAEIADSVIQSVPGADVNRAAAEYSLFKATADQLPDSNLAGKVSVIPLKESQRLADEAKLVVSPTAPRDTATIGEDIQRTLQAKAADAKDVVDTWYASALSDEKIPVTGSVQSAFSSAREIINKATRRFPGLDKSVSDAQRIISRFVPNRAGKSLKNITVRDMDNLHKGLVKIQGKVGGAEATVIGNTMSALQKAAPQELREAWASAASHAEQFLSPETSFVSKLLTAKQTRGAKGKQLLTAPEVAVNLIKKATVSDFNDLANVVGKPEAQRLFQNAFASEIGTQLRKGARNAPRGSGAPMLEGQLNKFAGREALFREVYGNDYDQIVKTYEKLGSLAKDRMAAGALTTPPFTPVKALQANPLGNTTLTINPGGGVRGYAKPTTAFKWIYGNKQDEVNRLIFNQLAPQYGLKPVTKSFNPPAATLDVLAPGVRAAGRIPAFAMADALDESPAPAAAPFLAGEAPPAFDFSNEEPAMTTTPPDVLSGKAQGLVNKIKKTESNNNPKAVSSKGAMGLMQITPIAIKEVERVYGIDLSTLDPFDPEQNEKVGSMYFAIMLDRYKGDEALALAAYNDGEGDVNKRLRKHKATSWREIERYSPKETRNYVKKILG